MAPNKSPVKKQRPLQMDCTSLLNHLSLVQNSIPNISKHPNYHQHMHHPHKQKQPPHYYKQKHKHDKQQSNNIQTRLKPNLQMVNFTKGGALPKRTSTSHEWYILVASTPFAISAQLVPVPKSRDSIVEPDVIQCTPISIWTCADNNGYDYSRSSGIASGTTSGVAGTRRGSGSGRDGSGGGGNEGAAKLEILNCNPIILIQEKKQPHTHNLEPSTATSTSSTNKKNNNNNNNNNTSLSLSVSVVLGTIYNRVLCIQLSIFSYVGISGREEGRYVLSKADENYYNNDHMITTTTTTSHSHSHIHHSQNHESSTGFGFGSLGNGILGRTTNYNDTDIGVGGGSGGGGGCNGVLEPLPLDTDETIRRKMMELKQSHQSHHHLYRHQHQNQHQNHAHAHAHYSAGGSVSGMSLSSSSQNNDIHSVTTNNTRDASYSTITTTTNPGTTNHHGSNGNGNGGTNSNGNSNSNGNDYNNNTNNNNTEAVNTKKKWVPFCPTGGVTSLSPLYKCRNHNVVSSSSSTRGGYSGSNVGNSFGNGSGSGSGNSNLNGDFVWITYGDGTMVRLPRWAFFPVIDDDDDDDEDDYYDNVDDEDDLDDDDDDDDPPSVFHSIRSGRLGRSHVEGSIGGLKDKLVKTIVIINPKNKRSNRMKNNENHSSDGTGGGTGTGSGGPIIMPLPKFFPSLMSQPLQTLGISSTTSTSATMGMSSSASITSHLELGGDEDSVSIFSTGQHSMAAPAAADYEFYEAVSFGGGSNTGAGDGAGTSRNKNDIMSNKKNKQAASTMAQPTLSFYTNEDQLFSKTHSNNPIEESNGGTNGGRGTNGGEINTTVQTIIRGGSTLIGGTASMAMGVFGGMMGAVLGRSSRQFQLQGTQTEEESMRGMEIVSEVGGGYHGNGDGAATISASTLFPSMHEQTTKLPLGMAIFDTPRRIINASIDPVDGMLMACADNLGRVQLIDLSTKQVIRIWKGVRDATCHWIQFPFEFETGPQIVKYLTIHCRERKIVEIYRMRHGPRVGKFATTSDAQVVQCVVALKGDESYTKCFILQTSSSTKRCIAKELMIHDDELRKVVMESSASSNRSTKGMNEKYLANHHSLSEGTIQLQLLKQFLASESAVPADLDAVYAALTQITAISDLAKAVDLLAVASHLENMGVDDSSFHVEVISHALEQLEIAMSDEIIATSNNPFLEELRNKIEFHTRLISSYDVLHRFETGSYNDNDATEVVTESKSSWVIEALSWIETTEEVRGQSIDANLSKVESNLTFSVWSKGCLQDSQGSKAYRRNEDGTPILYLCDSTRDRKNILLHIFQPLTKDIFIFKTTQQIFEQMGIHKDYDTLLQYYGEWFMSLPKAIIEKECLGIWCPTVRWLHDIVQESVNTIVHKKSEEKLGILLHSLHKFCVEATDLPRAFLLATVCREAIHAATKQLEKKTYGVVTCETCVKPWEELLRKLRVCLLVSLRLNGKPTGPLPITVSNVESGEFSIYEWIARDLFSFSHNQLEIEALEIASASSNISFHPSSVDGDKTERWKMVQDSCKTKSLHCPTNESQSGPLLFFLKHYNHSRQLAAHRALLLGQQWGRDPALLHLLKDAIASLQNIGRDEEAYSSLLAAALLQIWEVHIRPIYRALLFGFDEVHELCEELIVPLCLDPVWFHNLNKISMKILALLLSTTDSDPYEDLDENCVGQGGSLGTGVGNGNGIGSSGSNSSSDSGKVSSNSDDQEAWPKLQEDITIKALFQNSYTLDESSLEAHNGIVCAVQLNDDLSLLPLCIDSFDSTFLRQSLSLKVMTRSFTADEHQISFIESSIRQQCEIHIDGQGVAREDLDDIVSLGRLWGLDKGYVLTQFLLVMYEMGKDDDVEELFNSITRLLDVDMFLDHGIAIVCVRLCTALSILKKVKQCRSILAMLDADTCEWVREQARMTSMENPDIVVTDEDGRLISLDNTHALILRMKRMSTVNRIDAYALSVMCETLLKAMDYLEGA